jgi:RsiW-degrading membrane proteinase PrsW (M82 family)
MAVLIITAFGVLLLAGGFAAAYVVWRPRPGVPDAGWYPDPAVQGRQDRWWDSRAWTATVRPGAAAAPRGRLFRGRFLGGWLWVLLVTIVVLVLGCLAFQATAQVHLMALTSFLAMTGVCVAFYQFVSRQLALHDVIGPGAVIGVAVATAGAVLLFAANVNSLIIAYAGIQVGTATVGFVEEGTKLFVPLVFYLLGRYRDPRAGIALALAAGFGFAVTETTQYAYAAATASGPDLCGNESVVPTVGTVIEAQVLRIFTVSPLHWLFTGLAGAVVWRLWHLYGSRGTRGVIAIILLVMVAHSVNDSSATIGCNSSLVSLLTQLLRWLILIGAYLVFKAMARKSTPPHLIGMVSRGWTPQRLNTEQGR